MPSKKAICRRANDLWGRFCKHHADLLNKTHEEYGYLLSGNTDKILVCVEEKKQILNDIDDLERERQDLILDVNKTSRVDNVGQLVEFMQKEAGGELSRHNSLLVSIVEKIRDQNKKNGVFINKSIRSLDSLKETAFGKKSYRGYDSKGASTKVG